MTCGRRKVGASSTARAALGSLNSCRFIDLSPKRFYPTSPDRRGAPPACGFRKDAKRDRETSALLARGFPSQPWRTPPRSVRRYGLGRTPESGCTPPGRNTGGPPFGFGIVIGGLTTRPPGRRRPQGPGAPPPPPPSGEEARP